MTASLPRQIIQRTGQGVPECVCAGQGREGMVTAIVAIFAAWLTNRP